MSLNRFYGSWMSYCCQCVGAACVKIILTEARYKLVKTLWEGLVLKKGEGDIDPAKQWSQAISGSVLSTVPHPTSPTKMYRRTCFQDLEAQGGCSYTASCCQKVRRVLTIYTDAVYWVWKRCSYLLTELWIVQSSPLQNTIPCRQHVSSAIPCCFPPRHPK